MRKVTVEKSKTWGFQAPHLNSELLAGDLRQNSKVYEPQFPHLCTGAYNTELISQVVIRIKWGSE